VLRWLLEDPCPYISDEFLMNCIHWKEPDCTPRALPHISVCCYSPSLMPCDSLGQTPPLISAWSHYNIAWCSALLSPRRGTCRCAAV